MGRPWWYDSYWDKNKRPPRKKFQVPRRQVGIWIILVAISLLLAASGTSFYPDFVDWLIGFVYYICRISMFVIFVRALLSWFPIGRYNVFVALLDDISEPILSPLRRFIPRFGMFDIAPLVAIAILYLIPYLITRLAS